MVIASPAEDAAFSQQGTSMQISNSDSDSSYEKMKVHITISDVRNIS